MQRGRIERMPSLKRWKPSSLYACPSGSVTLWQHFRASRDWRTTLPALSHRRSGRLPGTRCRDARLCRRRVTRSLLFEAELDTRSVRRRPRVCVQPCSAHRKNGLLFIFGVRLAGQVSCRSCINRAAIGMPSETTVVSRPREPVRSAPRESELMDRPPWDPCCLGHAVLPRPMS